MQAIRVLMEEEEQNRTKLTASQVIGSIKYILFTIFGVLAVTLVSYTFFSFQEGEVTPKQQIKNIAGEAITQGAKAVNPDKQEKRYVSALIMGIDTRGVKFDGEKYVATRSKQTRKIDVMMQVLYDREQKKLTYISIPRDTSLNVEEACMHQEREDQKYINRIYDMAEKNNCPFSGADAMKKYVTYITGYEVDHYAIITLDSFVELIDIVGEEHQGKKGIWIDVPRNISDYCPNKTFGYDYVFFKQGRQFMTPSRALCYVRVRKSSSDFDRNRRQQQVVNEVMRLITADENLSNPVTLYNLYNKNRKTIQMSEITLQDVTLGMEIASEVDLTKVHRIVLDHEFGGRNSLLTKPLYSPPGTHTRGGGYYLIPTAWNQECCKKDEWKLVRAYLQRLVEDPDAVNDSASTFAYVNRYTGGKAVFNNSGYKEFKAKAADEFLFYTESKHALPMLANGPDVQVFDFSAGGSKRNAAMKIAELSGGKVYPGSDAPFKPLNNEEIAIVVRPN